MNEDVTFWLRELQAGNTSEAANEIWNRYFPRLAQVARRKLKALPKVSRDEEDVALSALNSFFAGAKEGRLVLRDRDELWKLLATITARKITAAQRRHFAQKRGGGQVRGDSALQFPGDESGGQGMAMVPEIRHMPEFVDQVIAACDELLQQLPSGMRLEEIAVMRLQGFGTQEIAERLGLARSTVKRKLGRIRDVWQGEFESLGD